MASVFKRAHTRSDGTNGDRWTVRYFDEKGVRRSKAFELKKDADTFKRKVEREIEDGTHVAETETMTVAQACKEYMAYNDQRARDGRIGHTRRRSVESRLDKFCKEIGNIPLNRLQMVDVERLFRQLSKTLKPSTARDQLGSLKSVQDYALKRRWMKSRPVDEALSELRGMERHRVRVPTTQEVRAILATIKTKTQKAEHRARIQMECMVNIAAFCGLRLGEILALKPQHVDLNKGIIEVRFNKLQDGTIKGPKTKAGIRDVPIPQHVRALLGEYIRRYGSSHPRNTSGLIFTTRVGNAVNSAGFSVRWRALLARAGIEAAPQSVHFHALRHFYASWLIQNGLPLTDVAKLLGHSKFDVTLQVYAHPIMDRVAQTAAVETSAARLLEAA